MLRKTSIKRKLTTHFVIVIALTVLIFEVLFTYGVHQFYYSNIEQYMTDRLRVTIDVYDRYLGYDSLSSKAKFILENTAIPDNVEAQILDLEGTIIESTARVFDKKKVTTPDFLLTISGEIQTWRGRHPETKELVLAVSAPLFEEGKRIGVVRYITSIVDVDVTVKTFLLYSYLIGIGVLVVVFQLSMILARGMVDSLHDLKHVADNIAIGNIKVRAVKFSDDEFGELADTLNYMSEEIQKSEQLKHDFISSISHELRTPLTAIKGWSETILTGDFQDIEETQIGLEIISMETERLRGLVENLLDFSKLEADRMEITFERFDIIELIERVIFQMSTIAKEKKINCHLSSTDGYIHVDGDRNRLRQVLINIIDNAIKYSPVGGQVICQVLSTDEKVIVTIRDYGIGIHRDYLLKVTDRFYKASTKYGGSGLGLAIAKGIIEAHKGNLTIESELDKGTAVSIILPVNKLKD